MRMFSLLLFYILILGSCIETPNSFERIPPGHWRAELYIQSPKQLIHKTKKLLTQKDDNVGRMDEIPEGIVPFEFEIKYRDNSNDFDIIIINGEERILVEDITYGFDKRIARDTLNIEFPIYQSYLELAYENGVLEGNWYVKTRKKYKIPFRAVYGKKGRFNDLRKPPVIDLTGEWKTIFSPNTDDTFLALGEFRQNGNHLSATFATEAGDFRYLDGTIQGDKLYLSTFDGSHAFLFTGTIKEDKSIDGMFYSGTHFKTNWIAEQDPEFKLQAPDKVTFVTDPTTKIEFEFPNEKGELVNFNDPKYDGKVKLIKIMGTWCPNCMDETKFLVDYINNNPTTDLEIFALSYEKNKEINDVYQLLTKFKNRYQIPYEVLYAGPVNKKRTAEQFPMLNSISSYPTMIYIDKKNRIRKIYTGFYGPATSEYQNFIKEFDHTVQGLLNE